MSLIGTKGDDRRRGLVGEVGDLRQPPSWKSRKNA